MKESSWHAQLPLPKATALNVSVEELHEMMQKRTTDPLALASYLVVDVRRTDFEVGPLL